MAGSRWVRTNSARPATSRVIVLSAPPHAPTSEAEPGDAGTLDLRIGRDEALVAGDLESVAAGLGVAHGDERVPHPRLLLGRQLGRDDELLDRHRARLSENLSAFVSPRLDDTLGGRGADLREAVLDVERHGV